MIEVLGRLTDLHRAMDFDPVMSGMMKRRLILKHRPYMFCDASWSKVFYAVECVLSLVQVRQILCKISTQMSNGQYQYEHLKCFTKQHNAVMIFYLSVNLLTNVIVRLTIAACWLHATDHCGWWPMICALYTARCYTEAGEAVPWRRQWPAVHGYSFALLLWWINLSDAAVTRATQTVSSEISAK